MAYKEFEVEKAYFTIGEVAEMMQVNASQIRFWEKEFDILKPKKNAKGDRFFTKEDVQNLKLIYRLLKEEGFTIEGAKARLKVRLDNEQKRVAAIEKLKKIKAFLIELKDQL